jgi:hypothetical protein
LIFLEKILVKLKVENIATSRTIHMAGLLLALIFPISSCVPLAIGAAGLAVGYIARDEGFGQAPSLENGGGSYETAPSYDAPAVYGDSGDSDMPVY